jgi:hypothetical protein
MIMDQMNQLNPQIVEVTVGTRKLRTIKLYPLSMADQLQLTSAVVTSIQVLFERKEENNLIFAETIQSTISTNLGKILSFVTEDGESLMNEVSNVQAVEIAEAIYSMNYEVLEKKVRGLIEKIRKAFLLPKSQPLSSEDTPNIDSNISSEEGIEKEE